MTGVQTCALPIYDFAPWVSSDGKLIVFASRREDGLNHVWRMDRDGGNPVEITHGKGEGDPAVSPDGRWVFYRDLSGRGIWRVSFDGGAPELLADNFLGDADISPDGKSVALSQFIEEGKLLRRHLVVIPAAGGKPTMKTIPWPDGYAIRWAPSGSALTYVKETEGVGNLWSQPLDGGAPKQVTSFTNLQIFSYDWTPDGKQLFLSRGQNISDVVQISDFH